MPSQHPKAAQGLAWVVLLLLPIAALSAEQPEIPVGCELDFRPYAFTDKDGKPTGFGVELLQAVGDKMGLRLRFSSGPWNEVWNNLVAGKIEVLPVVARTPSREALADFSLPHTETFDAFFRRAGQAPLPNLAAAAGKEIVVLNSDAAHHELLERHFNGRIITVESIPDGLSLIAKGKHDAFLCSKLVGMLELDEARIQGIQAGPPIPDYKPTFSFAIRKGNAELLEKLNQGLMLVKTSGEYDKLYNKWLSGPDPLHRWLPYMKWIFAALLVLSLLVAVLQWLVRRRTRELRELNATLEQRVAERTATLRESERKFRIMADTAPSMLWVTGHEARATFLSRGWYEFTGQTEADALGKDGFGWLDAVHPDDRQEAGRIFVEANRKREPFTLDYRVRRADGEYRWAIDSGRPRFDEQGNFFGYIGSVIDITERKQAQEALRQTQQRLELALKSAGGVPWSWNVMENLLDEWTPEYRELFGFVPNEPPKFETWLARVHPDDRERLALRVKQMINTPGDDMWNEEFRILHPQRGERWLGGLGRAFRDENGCLLRMAGVNLDITPRRQAEAALRASEQKYRRLHESMRDAFIVVDMAGRIQDFNAAYREMLGYTEAELRQLSYTDLTPATWHTFEARIVEEQILPMGSSSVYEKEYRRKDGTVFPVELRTSLLRDHAGQPQQMWAIVRDITERKRIEHALRQNQEQVGRQFDELEAIYRTVPLGLCVLDGELRYRRVNQRFAEINGVPAEDHIGRTVREVVPSLAEQAEEVMRRVLQTGQAIRFEFSGETLAQPGVQRIWDEHWYPLRDAANQIVGIGVVVEEITARRRMEQELRETQRKLLLHSAQLETALDEAQCASRAKDQFLASLSHELRTPLTPAVLQISILKRTEDLPPAVRRSLEIIERNIKLESQMVNDLLDLSRIINNKLELNPVRCDLHDIIERALDVCLDGGNTKKLDVVTRLEAVRRDVCVDATRLQQVFWNLIQNAFKFTPVGGRIMIRSRDVDTGVSVEVADTGCGIDAPLLGRLFQPFEQGKTDSKDALRGLGLGLAIAKRIVTAHGGTLTAASEGRDRGATFTLLLKTVESETSPNEGNKHEPKN